jgi:hypothetical protein
MENQAFSSKIELEIDSSSGHLSSTTPKEVREGAQRATFRQLGKWGAQGNVTFLQHGTLRGRPASIVGFDFRFLFETDGSSSRFSKAKVVVTFETASKKTKGETPPPLPPVIKRFSPKLMEGPVTRAKIVEENEYIAGLTVPTGTPVEVGAMATRTNGKEYTKDHRVRIDGKKWSSDEDAEDDNMVVWNLSENSKQGDGIPSDIKVALLVQHDGKPFHAIVKVRATTKSNLSLFGWPWPEPSPLVLSPEVTLGEPIELDKFEDLTNEHWESFIDLQGAVEVRTIFLTRLAMCLWCFNSVTLSNH